MTLSKFTAVGLAVLLVAAGGGAALTGAMGAADTAAPGEDTALRDVDVDAQYDNGTVTMTVTSNGSAVENVSVYADDERVGTTDANGTVTFESDADEELEVELVKGEFEGELEYVVQDGTLTLVEEEYEYAELDEDEEDERDDEDDEREDEAEEDEDDEDDEDEVEEGDDDEADEEESDDDEAEDDD